MSKIENNMSDIISDEAFNAVADYLGQFDLKIEKMDEKINKCEAANKNREKKDDEIKQIKEQMAKFKAEPTSNGASSASALFEENSEEIKESGRKLELTFPMKLEKAVALSATKRIIADTGKSIDNLEGEIEEESFFSNDSYSKVVVAFEDVPTRKEAQAVVCLTREGKRWRGLEAQVRKRGCPRRGAEASVRSPQGQEAAQRAGHLGGKECRLRLDAVPHRLRDAHNLSQ